VTAMARMAVLNLRTVAPYRIQGLVLLALVAVMCLKSPLVLLPALALLITPVIAAYPFLIADKAGLETLYAVLPLPRRSVVYGHYAWAMTCYLVPVAAGTALDVLLARVEAVPFSGRDLLTMLTLSWALFAVNIAIQFPLLIWFGYTRVSVLATTLPVGLILVAVLKLHVFSSIAAVQAWLPLLGGAGVAAMAASVAVAITADRRRVRYGRPERDDPDSAGVTALRRLS
jgi:ABC-2 family transporter protein